MRRRADLEPGASRTAMSGVDPASTCSPQYVRVGRLGGATSSGPGET
ncbi:MAG: hypothetical protein LH650_16620 [Chloroflexi bacterium]|nr:hypothetical protein [Chloroflexota bacterium]